MLMIQSFNKIVSLFQLIFKKNDLLGGKFSVSEFLWSADKKKQQKALYQAGADGIYEYIEALKVDGTNAAEAFEKAMAGVDSRIKGQANIIRDDTAALSSYANKLSGAARGLEATGTSMDKLSLKAKAANFAVNALNTIAGAATGMLVGTALSWTANAIISGFDAAIVTTEELAEAAEEAQSSIATLTEDYKTLHDTVLGIADAGGIAQEFAKLAQGVDRAGQNVSLTSDQYERYLELSNQLATMFPELNRLYDSNGNAIVSLSGDIDSIVSKIREFVEAEQQATNISILENVSDVYKNIVAQVGGYQEILTRAQHMRNLYNGLASGDSSKITDEELQNISDQYASAFGYIDVPIKLRPDLESEEQREATELINQALKGIAPTSSGLFPELGGGEGAFTLRLNKDDFENQYKELIKVFGDEDLTQYLDTSWSLDITKAEQGIAESVSQLTQFINTNFQTQAAYLDLSPMSQAIVSELAGSFNPIELGFKTSDEWFSFLNDNVLATYSGFMDTSFGPVLEQLYELQNDPNLDVERYLELTDKYVASAVQDLGLESVEKLREQYPEIARILDMAYGDIAALYEDYEARISSLTGDKSALDNLVVTASDMEKVLGLSDVYSTYEDVARALQASQSAAVVESQLEEIAASVDTYADYQEALAGALSSQELSVEQYETLIGYSEEYRNALVLEGEQMTLNREAVAEINKAQQEKIQGNIKEGRSAAQIAYHRNRQELEALRDTYESFKASGKDTADVLAQISDLETTQLDLQDSINQYNILASVISNVSQAYEQYESASQAPSPEDHYETNLGAMADLEAGFESGKVGTAEFEAAVDLLVPKDVYEGAKDEIDAIYDYWNDTLKPLFTATGENEDDYTTGISNFLEKAEDLDLMTKNVDDNGFETWTVNTGLKLSDFAEQMGITEAAAESMFRVMDSYTWGGAFSYDDEFFSESSITNQMYMLESQIDNLEAQKMELLSDPNINWNDEQVRALQEEIDRLKQSKESLAEETVVNVTTRVSKLQQIDQLDQEIVELKRTIESAPEPVKIELKAQLANKEATKAQLEKEVAEMGGMELEPIEVELTLENIPEQKARLLSEIQSIDPGAIEIDGEIQLSGDVVASDELNAKLAEWNQLDNTEKYLTTHYDVSVSGDDAVDETNTKLQTTEDLINRLQSQTLDINVDTTGIQTFATSMENAKTAVDNTTSSVNWLTDSINSIPTSRDIYITEHISTVSESSGTVGSRGIGGHSAKNDRHGKAQGTAHAYGTARAKGTDLFPSNWKLKRPELALTGELGPEMVVRGNEWFLAGENGTEFNQLQKGDIVFNHLQTEQLLNKGAIRGRGKARLKGTLPEEGLALVTGSFSFRKYQTSNWSGGSSGSSSSSTEASYNYNGSGGSSGSSDEDDFRETIDWVEKELDRLQRKIDQTAITAESAYKTFSERNKALASEYDQITNKMEENRKGIARYEAEADSVGLSESYAKLVRDGTIDIETITDEDLKDKIDQYTEWYFLMPLYLVTGGGYSVELLESPKGSQATA